MLFTSCVCMVWTHITFYRLVRTREKRKYRDTTANVFWMQNDVTKLDDECLGNVEQTKPLVVSGNSHKNVWRFSIQVLYAQQWMVHHQHVFKSDILCLRVLPNVGSRPFTMEGVCFDMCVLRGNTISIKSTICLEIIYRVIFIIWPRAC